MTSGYFLTVCLNPVVQKTIVLPELRDNEVNRSSEYYMDASGKGIIVSRVLVQLGEPVIHLTQAGGWNRELFLSMAEKDGIKVHDVGSGSEIRFCYTLIDMLNRTSTEIVEEAVDVGEGTEKAVLQAYEKLLPDAHTVIISGTKAGGFSETVFPRMVENAKNQYKEVILDFRRNDLINVVPLAPHVIKPNYDEFCSTFFPAVKEDAVLLNKRVEEKMKEIYARYETITILSRGALPGLYMDRGTVKTANPPEIVPLNTTGCGDALTAGFASSYAKGRSIEEAVAFGLECARRNALSLRPGVIQ
jgi:1-phosphofructokinase family hexose kinase